MEDEIFDIVTDLLRDDISKQEAIDKLLILYSVSNNEERVPFCDKHKEEMTYDTNVNEHFCWTCEHGAK
jgi:hypothetical protein|tara:strand:+ start:426 stop:632 length:207 start_codon:yes stop_codon:yes gene_type:complete